MQRVKTVWLAGGHSDCRHGSWGLWRVARQPQVPPSSTGLGTVKIGTNAEYPPFESVDANGKIIGFDIDLMNAIGKAAGFTPEFTNTKWDGIFVALASGEFDAVSSAVTITEERKQDDGLQRPLLQRRPDDRREEG